MYLYSIKSVLKGGGKTFSLSSLEDNSLLYLGDYESVLNRGQETENIL